MTAESTYDDIVKTLPALYDKAVTNTRLSLDKNSMKRISQVLQKAECIDIYGTGISYILAQSAAFKISTLGLECSAYESINSHYLAARKHKKNIAFFDQSDRIKSYGDLHGKIFKGGDRNLCGRNCRSLSYRT